MPNTAVSGHSTGSLHIGAAARVSKTAAVIADAAPTAICAGKKATE